MQIGSKPDYPKALLSQRWHYEQTLRARGTLLRHNGSSVYVRLQHWVLMITHRGIKKAS